MSERPDRTLSRSFGHALAVSACTVAAMFCWGCDADATDSKPGSDVAVRSSDTTEPLHQAPVDPPRRVEFHDRVGFRSEVLFKLDEIQNLIRIDLPELMSSRERAIAFAPVMGMPEEAHFGRRHYRAEGLNSRVEASWDLVGDAVLMNLSVTNTGEKSARAVTAAVCVQSAFAPSFLMGKDKASFFSAGRPLSFPSLDALEGYRSAGAFVETGPWSDRDAGRGSDFLGSYSAHHSDHGIVFRTSNDGAWTLATLWEDAYRVYHNPMKHLDCMHSDPSFGDIEPGATVTRRGWLLLHHGTPQQARERLLELWRASDSGHS